MKIAIIADAHLVSPTVDLSQRQRRERFRSLVYRINQEGAELAVSLGDLVNWFSDENVRFVQELMDELQCPWVLTPGNHDLKMPGGDDARKGAQQARRGWEAAGIELGNRVVEVGPVRLVLLDSALGEMSEETKDWLNRILPDNDDAYTAICTHMPLDLPPVRAYVRSVKDGDVSAYVQHGSRDAFEAMLRGRVNAVYSGHLHVAGRVAVSGTVMDMLPLSISPIWGGAAFIVTDAPDEPRYVLIDDAEGG